MNTHHFAAFRRFVWCLFFALSLIGCAPRITLDLLRDLNPHADVIDVCTRLPTVGSRSDFWAVQRSTGRTEYQKWHRDMETKVVDWITDKKQATPAEFEAWLRYLYKTDNELNRRFPNGF